MMSSTQFDREYENLERAYDDGEITYAEMHDAMKDLQESAKAQAEESAEAAYRDSMGWH